MDNKFKYVVELGYTRFEFYDDYEAMKFANKAKESATSEDLSVTIEVFIVNRYESDENESCSDCSECCDEEKSAEESESEGNEETEESEEK